MMIATNKTSYAILGMLSIAPMSGYEIRQIMKESTANFWSESDGQLYPALTKLSKLGLVSGKADKTSIRDRKVYHLTSKGTTELKKWLTQEPQTHIVRNELMLKLFFGANVSPELNIEHLQAQRYKIKTMLVQLNETKKELASEYKNSAHLPYWLMSIQYGIDLGEARLKWCNDAINQLKKIKRGWKA